MARGSLGRAGLPEPRCAAVVSVTASAGSSLGIAGSLSTAAGAVVLDVAGGAAMKDDVAAWGRFASNQIAPPAPLATTSRAGIHTLAKERAAQPVVDVARAAVPNPKRSAIARADRSRWRLVGSSACRAESKMARA